LLNQQPIGRPIKNLTFFEIPYFCSHYRYNHAVFGEITAENNKQQFVKRVLNILCKLVKIWYLVNISDNILYNSNNMNFKVCHRVLSQSVCAFLSLIQAMLNIIIIIIIIIVKFVKRHTRS